MNRKATPRAENATRSTSTPVPTPCPKQERKGQTVMVIGGSGGLSSHYRNVVERHGVSLRHYENKVPASARREAGKIALIVIMVGMVSHALRDQVQSLASSASEVVYLRSASVSALRAVVDERLGA